MALPRGMDVLAREESTRPTHSMGYTWPHIQGKLLSASPPGAPELHGYCVTETCKNNSFLAVVLLKGESFKMGAESNKGVAEDDSGANPMWDKRTTHKLYKLQQWPIKDTG